MQDAHSGGAFMHVSAQANEVESEGPRRQVRQEESWPERSTPFGTNNMAQNISKRLSPIRELND